MYKKMHAKEKLVYCRFADQNHQTQPFWDGAGTGLVSDHCHQYRTLNRSLQKESISNAMIVSHKLGDLYNAVVHTFVALRPILEFNQNEYKRCGLSYNL